MWYQFKNGICISTSSFEPAREAGIVSVWSDEIYNDIENLRLIDGKVVRISD